MNIEALLAEARDNSPKAQYEAYNYFFERSRKSSVSEAERESSIYEMEFWLRKAAFNNYSPAQLELARAEYDLYNDLIHSEGEKDNFMLAFVAGDCVHWYRKAIAQNYAPAIEMLENVKAFDKSINEFKARNNLTGKNPYEDLFYNEAPMAFLAGRHPNNAAQPQDETEDAKGNAKSSKGLIIAIAVVAAAAVLLGVGAALFKEKSADKLSTPTTAAGTTVPAIFETTPPVTAAQAQKTGVNDNADLLSEEERQALQLKIDALAYKYKFDVALLTVADTGGKDVRAYAADYYKANGYGIGENRDGLVFIINMATAEYYTSASGYGVTAFTSDAVKEIGAAMNADLASGSYFKAFGTYLDYVDKILLAYQNGEPYEGSTQPQGTTAVVTAAGATVSAKRVAVVSTQSEPLNIRKEPVATADKVGQFAKGAKVTVEGEAVTDATGAKWYRCTGTNTQGAIITGYCNASFLTF